MRKPSPYRVYPYTEPESSSSGGSGSSSFSSLNKENLIASSDNQTAFTLNNAPLDNKAILVALNGVIVPSYNIQNAVLNYTDSNVSIESGDIITIVYFT